VAEGPGERGAGHVVAFSASSACTLSLSAWFPSLSDWISARGSTSMSAPPLMLCVPACSIFAAVQPIYARCVLHTRGAHTVSRLGCERGRMLRG